MGIEGLGANRRTTPDTSWSGTVTIVSPCSPPSGVNIVAVRVYVPLGSCSFPSSDDGRRWKLTGMTAPALERAVNPAEPRSGNASGLAVTGKAGRIHGR